MSFEITISKTQKQKQKQQKKTKRHIKTSNMARYHCLRRKLKVNVKL